MTPGISLCMIVRNEAAVLARALENWRLLADELVICDTGSTDNTLAIAQGAGAHIVRFQMPEPGHLGAARNHGLQYAGYEWVFVLDADEEIKDHAGLRAFVLSQPPDVGMIEIIRLETIEGTFVKRGWQPRIFRNGTRYKYRCDEWPVATGRIVRAADFTLTHHFQLSRKDKKDDFYLRMLELDVLENPGDPHPLNFLCQRSYCAGHDDRAIDVGLAMLRMALPLEHRAIIADCIASAYWRKNLANEAIYWQRYSVRCFPAHRWYWWMLARFYYFCGAFTLALRTIDAMQQVETDFSAMMVESYIPPDHIEAIVAECRKQLITGELNK